jgi:hypothetical protein
MATCNGICTAEPEQGCDGLCCDVEGCCNEKGFCEDHDKTDDDER